MVVVSKRIKNDLKKLCLPYTLGSVSSDDLIAMIDVKAKLHPSCRGYIPFIYKRDIQLFIKRLRKYIKNEKIQNY